MKKVLLFLCLQVASFGVAVEFDAAPFLKRMSEAFASQNLTLATLSPTQVASLANEWESKAAGALDVTTSLRQIDPAQVEKTLGLLQGKSACVFMRHGEQQPSGDFQIQSVELQKIAMMRLPDNVENGITKASAAEWVGSMIVWRYLKEKTALPIEVQTSVNRRAAIPATALATMLGVFPCVNPALTCVNYPAENQMTTAEILKVLPDGALPWDRQKVDKVIGPGTYARIMQDMTGLLNDCQLTTIFVTHTQQLNALATIQGFPTTRLGNYGFILVSKGKKEVFESGFYKKLN